MQNKFFNDTKPAFTLAEVLIAIALLGTIAAITMPMIKNAIPNKYEAMHKKADYALEHTVAEIVNDDYLYGPQKVTSPDPADPTKTITNTIYGLKNTYAVNVGGTNYSGNTKFCELFASKFSKYPGTTVRCNVASTQLGFSNDNKTPTFTSSDGIQWLIQRSDFNNSIVIAFRVSTENDNNAPHCAYLPSPFRDSRPGTSQSIINSAAYINILAAKGSGSSKKKTFASATLSNCQKPDTFIYVLTPEGKLIKDSPTTDTLSPNYNSVTSSNSSSNKPETSGANAAHGKRPGEDF